VYFHRSVVCDYRQSSTGRHTCIYGHTSNFGRDQHKLTLPNPNPAFPHVLTPNLILSLTLSLSPSLSLTLGIFAETSVAFVWRKYDRVQ
jgi:hypothetical protein